MKVIIENRSYPFFLAHGGEQIQVHKTIEALAKIGVEVEFSRWWDGRQSADVIHCFGTPSVGYIEMAHKKGMAVVNTTLFTATCNRSDRALQMQGLAVQALLRIPDILPWSMIRNQLKWEAFGRCDCNIVGIEAEKHVLETVYAVPAEKIRIVPLGLSDVFLSAVDQSERGEYLITTGTITARKRSLELARMAIETKVPVCFVGKPYDTSESYWKEFERLIDGQWVRHVSHTDNQAQLVSLLQGARGYVLHSDYENWCLSAHEAVACGLPILVPDQKWSRERFGDQAYYFSGDDAARNARTLRAFWNDAACAKAPKIELFSWDQVGRKILSVYQEVVACRR